MPDDSSFPTIGHKAKNKVLQTFLQQASALVDAAVEHLSGLESTDSVEATHQLRVSVRRLRALWWAYRPFIDHDQREAQEALLKRLTTMAGAARDWDVLLNLYQGPQHSKFGSGAVDEAVQGYHEDAIKATRDALKQTDVENVLREAVQDASDSIALAPIESQRRFERRRFRAAEKTLKKRMKAASKASRDDYEALHAVRKAAKRVRYVLEFFDPEATAAHKALRVRLKKLQNRFGALNDAVASEALLRENVSSSAAVLQWLHTERKHRLRKAKKMLPGDKRLWPD